ncbi:hypothetical protein ACFXHA_43025 [Nocardia sp. NPDC059240]|uniref:hypothetical protein n=1 Tax=Nocardia sp. NPDC059240 TaxID=3346786 RepID=UPI0036D1B8DA
MFFDDLKAVLDKAETKWDVTVVLGAGVAGFVVDALAISHGVMSPMTVSALSATGALSLKKGWDASRDTRRQSKAARQAMEKVTGAPVRARELVKFFADEGYKDGDQNLPVQLVLHEKGIIDDEQLNLAVDKALSAYLTRPKKLKRS